MSAVVVCAKCGQRGDERPGLKLSEYRTEAVFVGDQLVPTPQRLTCLACNHSVAVPRGSIDVVPVTPT